ncbi:MAG TPA: helix-turn-helix domain-containing protein [Pirellulales bacterium]|jgi:DNA-binding transcriptional regulator YiaG|nr:helix-turn-helix domain-containing protein [Pirellulales bacterium]
MVSFVAAFKEQIRRLARKEIRAQVAATKRAAAQHRRDIARIKRQLTACLRRLERLEARQTRGAAPTEPAIAPEPLNRFSARSVRAQRKRLKLSAGEYGRLVGVSGQTIYQWEQGKSRPRKSQFASLIALRSIGRREALARLSEGRDTGR